MSILPTNITSPAVARPRAWWSMDMSAAVSCDRFATTTVGYLGTQIFADHLGTNHGVSTGSKRLHPGPLDEVST